MVLMTTQVTLLTYAVLVLFHVPWLAVLAVHLFKHIILCLACLNKRAY